MTNIQFVLASGRVIAGSVESVGSDDLEEGIEAAAKARLRQMPKELQDEIREGKAQVKEWFKEEKLRKLSEADR